MWDECASINAIANANDDVSVHMKALYAQESIVIARRNCSSLSEISSIIISLCLAPVQRVSLLMINTFL